MKTIDSGGVALLEIEVPTGRAGSFTPRQLRKGQRRLEGLDAGVYQFVRRWDGQYDKVGHPPQRHGWVWTCLLERVSRTLADAVCEAVLEWQRRP